MEASIADLRKSYHRSVCEQIIRISKDKGKTYYNFADSGNRLSIEIANDIVEQLGYDVTTFEAIVGQSAGGRFESLTRDFLRATFERIHHLRPGTWQYITHANIARFEQYKHLAHIKTLLESNRELASALGGDYIITPDIVISRSPITDDEINQHSIVIKPDDEVSKLTPVRLSNVSEPADFLHASISCKWTIRSDRSQNSRTEALNLLRNRKGHAPHILAITAEPLPTRIAALALGTGDLDCVYHFALDELIRAVQNVDKIGSGQSDMLHTLIEGKRLRDISDLPFDLVV